MNQAVVDALMKDGGPPKSVTVAPLDDGDATAKWLVIANWGWAEAPIATCNYPAQARGVALALADALGCEFVGSDRVAA